MKKCKLLILMLALSILTGCSVNAKEDPNQQQIIDESRTIDIGTICDIRPIEFTNEHKEDYLLHKNFPFFNKFEFFQNDTTLHIACKVNGTITYDANQIKVVEKRNKYEITLPNPTIHAWIDVDSLSEDDFYYTSTKWWGTKKFNSKEQENALAKIEKQVQESYASDTKHLTIAKSQIKQIITDALHQYNRQRGINKDITFLE